MNAGDQETEVHKSKSVPALAKSTHQFYSKQLGLLHHNLSFNGSERVQRAAKKGGLTGSEDNPPDSKLTRLGGEETGKNTTLTFGKSDTKSSLSKTGSDIKQKGAVLSGLLPGLPPRQVTFSISSDGSSSSSSSSSGDLYLIVPTTVAQQVSCC